MTALWITLVLIAVVAIAVWLGWKPLIASLRAREARRAIDLFRRRREQLEAKFFDLAGQSGKPRGLRWKECDWQPDVTFARDARTGLLTAFVAVNIHFEAIEGGDMEDVAAVGDIRDAAAVFHYRRGRWGTGGRALFNMNPSDAVIRLAGQYVAVEADAEVRE